MRQWRVHYKKETAHKLEKTRRLSFSYLKSIKYFKIAGHVFLGGSIKYRNYVFAKYVTLSFHQPFFLILQQTKSFLANVSLRVFKYG